MEKSQIYSSIVRETVQGVKRVGLRRTNVKLTMQEVKYSYVQTVYRANLQLWIE